MLDSDKKIVYSAAQPTGNLTLGNYIGAVRNWVNLQNEYNCIYCVADLHSITVETVPADLRASIMKSYATFLSAGLDTDKSIIYVQSQVPAHTQLTWILNCFTQFGEASRMTQFKDKSKKAPENVNVGLFSYPVLMAADILLYKSDYVPIGIDQKQHVELARTIAERFNNRYSETFTVPDALFGKSGAKIYSLTDPTSKMSKSDKNPGSHILMLDKPEDIISKFKKAVTDSGSEIRYDIKEKPGISNLLTIYATVNGISVSEAEKEFAGRDYAFFKKAVGEAVAETLRPIRENFERIIKDKEYILQEMKKGAEKAAYLANKTVQKVYRKVGFVQ